MNELSDLAKQSPAMPPSQRASMWQKAGRLIALKELTAINSFQRDQSRLNARNRAAYKKLGVDVEDDDTIQNILGDMIVTNTEQAPESKAQPQQSKGVPGWLAALLTAGALAAGVAGSQLMDGEEPPPAVAPDDGGIGYSLEIR